MKGVYCVLVFLPFFTKFVHTDEPVTMLDAIMLNCSVDESLKVKLEALPEFTECQNWTVIKNVDVSDFSAENTIYLKCLLYHDALISLCRRVNSTNASSVILSTEPDNTSVNKVCEYFVAKQNESRVLKDMNSDMCKFLCWKMIKTQLITDALCTKSYTFFNYIKNDPQKVVNGSSSNQKPLNVANEPGNKRNNTDNQIDSNKSIPAGPDQTPNLEGENKSKKGVVEILSPMENENTQVVNDEHNKPKTFDEMQNVSKLKPIESNENGVVQKQVVQDSNQETVTKPDTALENVNNQEVPPTDLNTNVQATDQGQAYQDDDDVIYRLEKNQKMANPVVETAPESIDDKEDLTPNDFKKPQVSPLSENFAYDSDLSGNSYFFSYFSFTCVVLVVGYVFYHNKQKVIALLVEGRHARRPQRTRRPNSANYHKLDSNLEEAISSSVSKNPSHVIY